MALKNIQKNGMSAQEQLQQMADRVLAPKREPLTASQRLQVMATRVEQQKQRRAYEEAQPSQAERPDPTQNKAVENIWDRHDGTDWKYHSLSNDWWKDYGSSFEAVKSAKTAEEFDAAYKTFSDYSREYDNWRGSIRDRADVEQSIASIDEQIATLEDLQRSRANNFGYEEVEAQLAALMEERRTLAEELGFSKYFAYGELSNNEDFAQKSLPDESQLGTNFWQRLGDSDTRKAYEYINDIGDYRKNLDAESEKAGGSLSPQFEAYKYMSEEQKSNFNYLYNTRGEEAAAEYLEWLKNGFATEDTWVVQSLNSLQGFDIAEGLGTKTQKALYGLRAGIDQFGSGMKQAFTEEEVPTSAVQYAGQAARGDLGKAGQFVYDTGMVTGNMLPSIALSVITAGAGAPTAIASLAGSATLGLSAGGNAYNQALKEGYTPDQAKAYGRLIGISEGSLQYLLGGIGKLGGVTDDIMLAKIAAIDKAWARMTLTGAVKIGSEVTEENLQEFIEPAIRSIIFDEKYNAPNMEELIYTTLLTVATTGLMEGGNIISAGASPDASVNDILTQTAMEMENLPQEGVEAPEVSVPTPQEKSESAAKNKAGGYGEYGSKALNEIMADYGMDEASADAMFRSAYDVGRAEVDREKANLINPVQEAAYIAGRQDAIMSKSTLESGVNPEYTDSSKQKGQSKAYGETENHIDNRTADTVAERGTKAFQFDHPELHQYYVQAANVLINDAENSIAEGRMAPRAGKDNYGHRKKGMSYQAPMSELLDRAARMDISRPQLIKALEDIIADNGQENYAAAKRAELLLDSMLSDGYTTSYGESVAPNSAYLSAKAAITGGQTEYQRRKAQMDRDYEFVDMVEGPPNAQEQARRQAEYAELKARYETEDASNGNEKVHIRNGGERAGSENTGRQIPAVEKGSGRNQSRNTESRSADGETAALTYGEKVSTSSLGIKGGSQKNNIRLVTGGDTASTAAAKQIAREHKLRLVLFYGNNLEIRQPDGTYASVRAMVSGDRVFVRVDHPVFTADQLMRHEAGHDLIAKGKINPNNVRERIREAFGAEGAEIAAQMYMEAYAETGLSPDDVWEEVICDSLGDMNIFAGTEKEGVATALLSVTKMSSADARTESTRGPPAEGKASREVNGGKYEANERTDDSDFAGTKQPAGRLSPRRENTGNSRKVRAGDTYKNLTGKERGRIRKAILSALQTDEEIARFILREINSNKFVEDVYDKIAVHGEKLTLEGVFPALREAVVAAADMNNQQTYEVNEKTGKAAWTKEHINWLFREYGMGDKKWHQQYAQAYAARMSPEEFLSLTATERIKGGIELEAVRKYGELDVEKLKQDRTSPQLIVDMETGLVEGHEGRHRMVLLNNEGVDNVPVVIVPYNQGDKYNRTKIDSISLSGQRWTDGAAPGKVEIRDVTPFSTEYRSEVESVFGGEAEVKFSRELDNESIEAMESRLNGLNAEYRKMETQDFRYKDAPEYKAFMDAISDARQSKKSLLDRPAELDRAIDEYRAWQDESGYTELIARMEEMRGDIKTLRSKLDRAREKAAQEAKNATRAQYNEEFAKKYAGKAARKFGTTGRFDLAGYLTVTGSLLDFSQRQGYRVRDHREIAEVLDFLPEDHGYSDGLIEFMNLGNIRMQSYGIDIAKAPNAAQKSMLRKFFNSLGGEVSVDLSDENGNTVDSLEYNEGTRADKILNDIDSYFKTGKVPQRSITAQFHYSRELDKNYMAAVNAGDMGKAQSMVDHRAHISGYNIKLYHGTAGEPFYVFRQGVEGIHFGTLKQATQRARVAENTYGYRTKKYTASEIRKNPEKFPDSARRAIIEEIAFIFPLDLTAEEMTVAENAVYEDEYITDEMLFYFIDKAENELKNTTYSISNRDMQINSGNRIVSAFVKAKSPLIFGVDIGEWAPYQLADLFEKKINGEMASIYDPNSSDWVEFDPRDIKGIELTKADLPWLEKLGRSRDFGDMAEFLQSKGIDSIRYLNTYEGTRDEESYILLSPEQVKSAEAVTYDDAGNVIPLSERFNISSKDIRYSRELAPVFYSRLEREIEATKQEKLGAASVINMLRGKGVKSEEIKWSGVEQFLEGKKSVSKQELLEFVRGNQLELEETVLGDKNGGVLPYSDEELRTLDAMQEQTEDLMEQASELWAEAYNEELPFELLTADDIGAAISREIIKRNGGIRNYVGNSRITETERALLSIGDTLRQIDYRQADLVERVRARQKNTSKTHWIEYKLDGGENYREYIFKLPGSDYRNRAMDVHWKGETGVIAHARVQDFDTADGKMLFVEEIQSDWHNEGHKSGYRKAGEKTDQMLREESREAYSEFYSVVERFVDENSNWEDGDAPYYAHPVVVAEMFEGDESHFDRLKFTEEQRKTIRAMVAEEAARQEAKKTAPKHGAAPDAPFKDTYHEYVMKRLIREAAEKGYDSIGWTTADIQSERWSKDYAEGYRIEYDQDIPKFLNKYGKKWGAKVGKTDIDTKHLDTDKVAELYFIADMLEDGEAYIRHERGLVEVWSMPITEAMKQSALYEGQARFSQEVQSRELSDEERKNLEATQAAVRAAVRDEIDRLGEEYGWIKAGENPAREVKVPQRTAEDKKVSQTVRTVMEAGVTPDEALPRIEELIAGGEFSYEVYGDEQALEEAREYIGKGWDEAQREWFADIRKGNVSKRNTAIGWLLYDNAVNSGNIDLAMDVLNAMVEHQRSAAQALQATRILKKLSPETQLYGVQKSIDRLQKELNERYGKGKAELKIDTELAQKFMEAQTEEEREKALQDIYRDIGRQMPSTFRDKFRAWRYLAMLGNARTHVRNILGNAFFAPVVAAKDLTATGIEAAAHRLSGGKTQRSKSLTLSRDLLSAAWADYEKVADIVTGNAKYNDLANANKFIDEGRRIFKTKALEAARRGNSKAMETEDAWFSRPHYAFAMAQFCKAHGITAQQLRAGKALGAAREYAAKEAQKATYRDTNALSHFLSSRFSETGEYAKAAKTANAIVEGILPFRKTPANILARGIEYSPMGLANGIKQALWDVRKGTKTSAEAIDSISAGMTGTALLGLGLYMAAQGLIRGHGGDDDEEREFEELMGHQSYALELPNGKSYTLDWLAPEALPFFIGVNLWEQTRGGKEELQFKDVLSAVGTVTEPLLEMSCLQSLNDIFEAVGYASGNDMSGLMTVLSSAATSYLTQAFPTLLGQIERTGEAERMTTYTEADSQLTNDMQYLIGKTSAKIPVWDFHQIPYIDAWGRTESSGGALERGFNNLLNPAYASQIETSDMEEALLDLYEMTGETSIFPSRAAKYFNVNGERKDLTAEEYVKYATEKGQTAYRVLTALTSGEAYESLDDAGKVEAISKVYEYANAVAKAAVSDYEPEGWVAKAIEAGKSAGVKSEQYVLLYLAQSNMGSLKDAEGKTIPNSHGLLVMQMIFNTSGLNEKQRQALFEAFGVSESIRHYNKSLVNEKLREMKRKAK